MALIAVRNKKSGLVKYLSPAVLTIFPDTWEPADLAVAAGLVETETEKVISEAPTRGKTTKKEASDA